MKKKSKFVGQVSNIHWSMTMMITSLIVPWSLNAINTFPAFSQWLKLTSSSTYRLGSDKICYKVLPKKQHDLFNIKIIRVFFFVLVFLLYLLSILFWWIAFYNLYLDISAARFLSYMGYICNWLLFALPFLQACSACLFWLRYSLTPNVGCYEETILCALNILCQTTKYW